MTSSWLAALIASGCAPARLAQLERSSAPAETSPAQVDDEAEAPAREDGAADSDPSAPPTAPQAVEPARFESLPVSGFLDAVVSLPEGAARQPVLVATHGAGGAPEHHCIAWRRLLGPRGIVLCPRGAMINRIVGPDAGFYYPDHFALDKEVAAALESFETAYAEKISPGPYVYAGYSQGATMGALMLPAHAAKFPQLVLIEGGFNEWSLKSARLFRANGGTRVAFVCGVAGCKAAAERSAQVLRRAELEVVTRHAQGGGHTYLGPVAQEIAQAFSWLVESDARWRE